MERQRKLVGNKRKGLVEFREKMKKGYQGRETGCI
jgi:hypothetical protein